MAAVTGPPQPYGEPYGQPHGQPPAAPYGQQYGPQYGQQYGQPVPYGYPPPAPVPYLQIATMADRLVARIIDWLLLMPLLVLLIFPGIVFMVASGDGTDPPSGASVAVFLLGLLAALLVGFLYEPLMISRRGATIGKRARRLTVRMEATGQLPTAKAAWLRFGVPLLAAIAPFGAVLVYVSPYFDDSGRRQGWHDKVARTVVVKG
jgi:uncharacterized RDD family membrane protein YckC